MIIIFSQEALTAAKEAARAKKANLSIKDVLGGELWFEEKVQYVELKNKKYTIIYIFRIGKT